jgi:hypothetical protein
MEWAILLILGVIELLFVTKALIWWTKKRKGGE